MKKSISATVIIFGILTSGGAFAQGQATTPASSPGSTGTSITPVKSGYAPVNGLKLYYEIYGKGEPLVLLHGGLGVINMFGPVLQELASKRQVIGVELQGHGHTADIDRPMSFEAMADDIAALLKHLGIPKADIMGYSLGGGTALQMAFRHPDMVRKLVVVSFPFAHSGWFAGTIDQAAHMGPASAEAMKQTPIYKVYLAAAPRPEDWTKLNTKLGQLLGKDYDYSAEVRKLKIPTLLVIGDADAVHIPAAVEFFGLLGGGQRDGGWDGSGRSNSRLAILPGQTHYAIFMSPALSHAALPFLEEPMPAIK
ncbi:MAG TPA: alpha/beta hydrolase [Puia sp.]|nr:alpha/beta hydrolase [Puia sp.]